MKNPLSSSPKPYDQLHRKLIDTANNLDPSSEEFDAVMRQLDKLDKIRHRTSELTKTVIPALGTLGGVAGIYAVQQFAGVIVPKALDAIASRHPQKVSNEFD